jgi:hypothetical protein
VRPKHVLIEFKKRMCYIDGQKNKYSVLIFDLLLKKLQSLLLHSQQPTTDPLYDPDEFRPHLLSNHSVSYLLDCNLPSMSRKSKRALSFMFPSCELREMSFASYTILSS